MLLLSRIVGVLRGAHELKCYVELVYPRGIFWLRLQKAFYFIYQDLLLGFVSANELVVLRLVDLAD